MEFNITHYQSWMAYLIFEAFQILFSNSLVDFYSCEVSSSSDMRKDDWSIKLSIDCSHT